MTEFSPQRTLLLLDAAQKEWAQRARIAIERPGYVMSAGDNLFLSGLNRDTETEFREGDGSEMRDVGTRPAKMRALLSSSALAVNFFDAWRETPKIGPLLLDLAGVHDTRLELTHAHGLEDDAVLDEVQALFRAHHGVDRLMAFVLLMRDGHAGRREVGQM